MKNPIKALYALCAAITLVLIVAWMREVFFPPALDLKNFQLLPGSKTLEPMALRSTNGPVNTDQLRGLWFLFFFGYTYCPDVCPLEMQKLGQMLKGLEASGKPKPVVVFVSVDPERDAMEQLGQYVAYFHPDIQAIGGDNLSVARLARFFGASYNRGFTADGKTYLVEAGADMPANAGEHYQVNHSSRIFAVNPQGEYIGSFAPPYSTEQLLADMSELMARQR